ncbi:uncharacterized protein LOC132196938 [Neocloeon triangulifer]|uniref:uncharacterized protein LOC132196938 n=1 Tax=Neocloeon triangulifer TaxID=2078957 RepID=UPI00286EEC1D|nr:uncharacterized protein LOC132196938 [Neocloeon triangulifer]
MVRRTAATLWFAVDILVLNRRFRCENDGSEEWSALEEWLRHQLAERQEMKARLQDAALVSGGGHVHRLCKKRQHQMTRRQKRRKSSAERQQPSFLPSIPTSSPLARPAKAKSKGRRCKDRPAAATPHCYPRHHQEKFEPGKSQRFMDRDYMQQMERRLVEQHEEAIQKRIKKRQAEEAQRERQMIQAGLLVDPHKGQEVVPPLLPRRSGPRPSEGGSARHASRTSVQRTPKRQPAPGKQQTEQQLQNGKYEENLCEQETVDEACPVPEAATLSHRPRLAILLQACKAVVGKGHLLNGAPAKTDALQVVESTGEADDAELGKHEDDKKYESPLIARLRQVEDVEELYRLAAEIVAKTKH